MGSVCLSDDVYMMDLGSTGRVVRVWGSAPQVMGLVPTQWAGMQYW